MHIATTLMFSFATHTHFTTIPTHAFTTNMNPTTTNMHYTTTNIHHVSTNMHTATTNMLVVHWLKEIHFDLARRQAPRGKPH